MTKILLVCSGNTCRSPMGQYFLEKLLHEKGVLGHYQISSAGIRAMDGIPVSHEASQVMWHNYQLDLSLHRSSYLEGGIIGDKDLILTMTSAHSDYLKGKFPEKNAQIYVLSEFAGSGSIDVVDPFGKGQEVYRECARQIYGFIEKIVDKLL